MWSRPISLVLAWMCVIGCSADNTGSERTGADFTPHTGAQEAKPETLALIEKLIEVEVEGVGYSASVSGSGFLPEAGGERVGATLLGQGRPVESLVLMEIVRQGASAVPALVAHLDDRRETKVIITAATDFSGIGLPNEYDFNRRLVAVDPPGVNKYLEMNSYKGDRYIVTVGDLCFVALGRIVNRQFSAVRYQPSGCTHLNSPCISKALLEVATNEWGHLTREAHRRSLLADVRLPDSSGRRDGAIQRLRYYYPEVCEQLILEELAKPMYCVFVSHRIVHGTLLGQDSPELWEEALSRFTRLHGEALKDGVLLALVDVATHRSGLLDSSRIERGRRILTHLYPSILVARRFVEDVLLKGNASSDWDTSLKGYIDREGRGGKQRVLLELVSIAIDRAAPSSGFQTEKALAILDHFNPSGSIPWAKQQ